MITERDAELLRKCEDWYPPRSDYHECVQLYHRELLDCAWQDFMINPAGRAALAEFDAAKLEGGK